MLGNNSVVVRLIRNVPFGKISLQQTKIGLPLVPNHFSTCKASNWNDHFFEKECIKE